jgi:ABC-type polysaccharide/polyol phosphate export permease
MHGEQTSLLAGEAPIRTVEGSAAGRNLGELLRDFYQSAKANGFWLYSSWIEILLSYRATALGPVWILIGTGVFVFAVGSLYGRVVLTGDNNDYLAHLALGLVLWYLVTQTIVGSCRLFWNSRANILDGENTFTDLILKLIATNLIYLAHNVIIVVAVFLYLGLALTWPALIVLLTFPLVVANILWMSVILSILGARYGDLDEFVHAALRLMFFLTPILWIPHEHVRGTAVDAVLYLNPFYYMIEVIRAPLVLGQIPYFEIAVVAGVLPFGWLLASLLYARTKSSVALWL